MTATGHAIARWGAGEALSATRGGRRLVSRFAAAGGAVAAGLLATAAVTPEYPLIEAWTLAACTLTLALALSAGPLVDAIDRRLFGGEDAPVPAPLPARARFSPVRLLVLVALLAGGLGWATHGERGLLARGSYRHVVFSPDGSLLAATRDGRVELRRVGGTLLASFEGGRCAFSPDGKHLATGGSQSAIYSADTGALEGSFAREDTRPERVRLQARRYVAGVAFTDDGERVVAATESGLELWSRREGKLLVSYHGPMELDERTGKIRGKVPYYPSGGDLVFAPEFSAACVWDLRLGKPIAETSYTTWIEGSPPCPTGRSRPT